MRIKTVLCWHANNHNYILGIAAYGQNKKPKEQDGKRGKEFYVNIDS